MSVAVVCGLGVACTGTGDAGPSATDPDGGAGSAAGSGGGGPLSAGAPSSGAPSFGGVGQTGGQPGMAGAGASSQAQAGSSGAAGAPPQEPGRSLVYVGGFGDFRVRAYELDERSGKMTPKGESVDAGPSPSYLAIDLTHRHLFAANEVDGAGAGVSVLNIRSDGTLEPGNHRSGSDNGCDGSCGFTFLAVSPSGKHVVAASYSGGSASVFPIGVDGLLGAESSLLDFGAGAKAHGVAFAPTGGSLLVPTLGLDRVQQLLLSDDGKLSAAAAPSTSVTPAVGPRHVALHPNGKLAFVMNETSSSITPCVLANGTLTPGKAVSTLPAGFAGESYGQHVEVSPDGRFVYGSNVGHDSIAVFAADPTSGALTLIEHRPSGGAWPRDFDLDPQGQVVVAANRDSHTLTLLSIGGDGKLTPLGDPVEIPGQPSVVVVVDAP